MRSFFMLLWLALYSLLAENVFIFCKQQKNSMIKSMQFCLSSFWFHTFGYHSLDGVSLRFISVFLFLFKYKLFKTNQRQHWARSKRILFKRKKKKNVLWQFFLEIENVFLFLFFFYYNSSIYCILLAPCVCVRALQCCYDRCDILYANASIISLCIYIQVWRLKLPFIKQCGPLFR